MAKTIKALISRKIAKNANLILIASVLAAIGLVFFFSRQIFYSLYNEMPMFYLAGAGFKK